MVDLNCIVRSPWSWIISNMYQVNEFLFVGSRQISLALSIANFARRESIGHSENKNFMQLMLCESEVEAVVQEIINDTAA